MILSIGEILYDQFHDDKRIGGAPFNFSYHLKKLNQPIRFVSRVGNDKDGRSIKRFIEQKGFDPDDIQTDMDKQTGKVLVNLDSQGIPKFEILKDVAYDYIEEDLSLQRAVQARPAIIYFGTLIQRTPQASSIIQKLLESRHPETKSFYDINLRPDCYNDLVIRKSLKNTDILKLNIDELQVLQSFLKSTNNRNDFVSSLMETFKIEMVALTKGADGSHLFTKEGLYEMPAQKVSGLEDTVGAGDGFAAVLALGCLKNWHPELMLRAATHFSSLICSEKGAIPDHDDFYDYFSNFFLGD